MTQRATTLSTVLAERQLQILRIGIPALGVYYALISVAHLVLLEEPARFTLVALAGVTAVGFAALTGLRGHRVVRENVHAVAAGVSLLPALNAVAHLVLTGEAIQTTNLLMVVVAAGALLTARWTFLLTLVAVTAGWAWAASLHANEPLWTHFAFALGAIELIAGLVFAVRLRAARAQFEAEAERDRVEAERQAAADAALAHEAHYRAVVSLSPAAIVVHRAGRVLVANSAAAELIGVHGGQDIEGFPLFDLFPEADRGRIRAWSDASLKGEADTQRLAGQLRALKSRWPSVELATAPLVWEGNDAAILVITDVTDREESDRLKEELIRGVGEAVRAPVAEALAQLAGDPIGERGVARALESLRPLQAVLDDLLELQRARASRLRPDLAPLELRTLVEAVVQSVGEPKPGVRIEVDGVERVGAVGERRLVEQVVEVLVRCALRASRSGQIARVTVRSEGGYARVEVTDEGPPPPAGLASGWFEQLVPVVGDAGGRLGPALSRCKLLIQAQDGEIGLVEEEEGVSIWFTLPGAAGI